MEDQNRKRLITINSNFSYETKPNRLGNSFGNFIKREISHDQLKHRMNTPPVPQKINSISIEQQKQLQETSKINAHCVQYADILSKAAQTQSTKSMLVIPDLTFTVPGITQDLTQHNANLRDTINQSMYILCKPDGALKVSLTGEDHYQIARVITNYLKKEIPYHYEYTIECFKNENRPGFQKVEKVEQKTTTSLKTTNDYPSDPLEMRQRVLSNTHNQELRKVIHLCETQQFAEAKYIRDCYKNYTMYGSATPEDDYLIINKLYNELFMEYCTKNILKPFNIPANQEIIELLHEVIPYAAARQQMKVIDHCITVLIEKQNDPVYYEAIKPLFDQRGLPRFYNFDEYIFKDIIIPTSITQPEHLKERVLLLKVSVLASQEKLNKLQSYRNTVGYIAKACSSEGLKKELYIKLAAVTIDALESKTDPTILQCGNLILEQPNQMQRIAQNKVTQSMLRLVDEINTLQNKNAPRKFVKDNQSNLLTIDQQFHEMHTFEDLCKINETIKKISHRLQSSNSPVLRRSPSLERLLAPKTDLLVSTNIGSISLAELKKFSGTPEQNIFHEKMVAHFAKVETFSKKIKDPDAIQVIATYKDLIKQAYEFNKDSCLTLAEGVFNVGKDLVEIALFDPPIKEIENYLVKTINNPTEYVIKTLEGYKCVASIILDACKHSLNGAPTTPEQKLEFAQHYNQMIHNFFEGWQQLEVSQKKEFLAQIIVDTALNKVAFSLPKLLLKIGGSNIITTIVEKGGSAFNRIDPGSSGAAVIASPVALAENVAVALEYASDVVSSYPTAIGSAATSGFNSLFDTMARRDNSVSFIAEGSPDYLEKCIKLKPLVDQPIETILDVKTVIHKVPLTSENKLIKEFDIIKNHYKHMFSDVHRKDGIGKLGINDNDIMEKFTNIVLDLDRQGMLIENGVQIEMVINGLDATIRVHVIDNKVLSINGFIGYSDKVIGKLIKYTYKGV